jgi:hypothetical protein
MLSLIEKLEKSRRRRCGCFLLFVGAIVTVLSLTTAIFVLCDKKKKKEEKELEDYLENSIQ